MHTKINKAEFLTGRKLIFGELALTARYKVPIHKMFFLQQVPKFMQQMKQGICMLVFLQRHIKVSTQRI